MQPTVRSFDIAHLAHVELLTPTPEESLNFFVNVMGLTESWWAILTIPGAVLIGFAFGSVGLAATTFMRSWQDFDLVSLVTMPLFLFSATFYPLDVYPPAIQPFIRLSPLYHGTEMLRAFSLGIFDWSSPPTSRSSSRWA